MEKTDFLLPMFVGEIAHLSAVVTYTSEHSLEVKVVVQAENLFSGKQCAVMAVKIIDFKKC